MARGIAGVESRSGPSNGGDLRPRNRGAVMWHSGLFRRTLTRRFAPACRTDSRWFGGRQKPPTEGRIRSQMTAASGLRRCRSALRVTSERRAGFSGRHQADSRWFGGGHMRRQRTVASCSDQMPSRSSEETTFDRKEIRHHRKEMP